MLAPRKKLWSTPQPCIEAAVDLAEINKDDILFDVGCGDGRVLLSIAAQLKDNAPRKMIGIEIDEGRAKEAKDNILAAKDSFCSEVVNIEIICANALEIDYTKATVIFLYLIPRGLRLIKPRLLNNRSETKELRVITYMAGFEDETPYNVTKCMVGHQGGAEWPIYFYRLKK